jgi:hypothetical protein
LPEHHAHVDSVETEIRFALDRGIYRNEIILAGNLQAILIRKSGMSYRRTDRDLRGPMGSVAAAADMSLRSLAP